MLYLVNPNRKGSRVARKRRTPRRGPGGRFVSNPKRKRAKATGRKRTTKRRSTKRRTASKTAKRTTKRRSTVARRRSTKRRKRRTSGRVTYTPVRGRIYRRNPRGFSLKGVTRMVQTGAINAGAVIAGKTGARVIANFLPLPKEGVMNYVTQVVAAVATGMVAKQFVSARAADFIFAGALSAPVETFLKGVPVIGGFLGDDQLLMGSGMGEYTLPMGEYPQGMGEYSLPIGEYVQY